MIGVDKTGRTDECSRATFERAATWQLVYNWATQYGPLDPRVKYFAVNEALWPPYVLTTCGVSIRPKVLMVTKI